MVNNTNFCETMIFFNFLQVFFDFIRFSWAFPLMRLLARAQRGEEGRVGWKRMREINGENARKSHVYKLTYGFPFTFTQ